MPIITTRGEYALRTLLDLALQNPSEMHKAGAIARRTKIPAKFLEAILFQLRSGGFITSKRGVDGGYMLARPADRIYLGDVVQVIEGASILGKHCPSKADDNQCSAACTCGMFGLWSKLSSAVAEILHKTTIQDLKQEYLANQNLTASYQI
ncbi:MAG TPA: Rrf2 family transcriptional regulator [Planctomycetota bacterium]|nr:Rrf2 family transcriptional regulator [Planctomycetota bacterium]